MGDTVMTVIAIFLAAILLFVFPLMAVSDRADDTSQTYVGAMTAQFVDEIRTSTVITQEKYDMFVSKLYATGNTYDVEIVVGKVDENPYKTSPTDPGPSVGQNLTYKLSTSQVLNAMEQGGGTYKLNTGDSVSVTVKNTNKTISQMLKGFLYTVTGNDTYKIAAQYTGLVVGNGNSN